MSRLYTFFPPLPPLPPLPPHLTLPRPAPKLSQKTCPPRIMDSTIRDCVKAVEQNHAKAENPPSSG